MTLPGFLGRHKDHGGGGGGAVHDGGGDGAGGEPGLRCAVGALPVPAQDNDAAGEPPSCACPPSVADVLGVTLLTILSSAAGVLGKWSALSVAGVLSAAVGLQIVFDAASEPNLTVAASGSDAAGESDPLHTSILWWVDAASEPTHGAGDSGGDATTPSSCSKQSLSGDISFLFFLALVTRGEMTGRARVVGVLAVSSLPGVTLPAVVMMSAVDARAVRSAAEAISASATAAAVASVAARLRPRHLLLHAALLALWTLR